MKIVIMIGATYIYTISKYWLREEEKNKNEKKTYFKQNKREKINKNKQKFYKQTFNDSCCYCCPNENGHWIGMCVWSSSSYVCVSQRKKKQQKQIKLTFFSWFDLIVCCLL